VEHRQAACGPCWSIWCWGRDRQEQGTHPKQQLSSYLRCSILQHIATPDGQRHRASAAVHWGQVVAAAGSGKAGIGVHEWPNGTASAHTSCSSDLATCVLERPKYKLLNCLAMPQSGQRTIPITHPTARRGRSPLLVCINQRPKNGHPLLKRHTLWRRGQDGRNLRGP